MGIDCKTKGHLSLPDKTGWKPYVCKQQVTVQIPVFKEKVSMWVQAGTENQCSVWDCCFMAQAGQQLQELKDLTIWKLVVQIRMDGHLWAVLTHLHQTGNGCWFSSCGEKKTSFTSPISARHQQHRNATALSVYCTQTTSSSSDYQAWETFCTKNTQRQCCLLTQLMTTPGLVSGPAQYSYSAGKRPQEGQTINTVLLMFNLSLDALDVEKTSVYMLWSIK